MRTPTSSISIILAAVVGGVVGSLLTSGLAGAFAFPSGQPFEQLEARIAQIETYFNPASDPELPTFTLTPAYGQMANVLEVYGADGSLALAVTPNGDVLASGSEVATQTAIDDASALLDATIVQNQQAATSYTDASVANATASLTTTIQTTATQTLTQANGYTDLVDADNLESLTAGPGIAIYGSSTAPVVAVQPDQISVGGAVTGTLASVQINPGVIGLGHLSFAPALQHDLLGLATGLEAEADAREAADQSLEWRLVGYMNSFQPRLWGGCSPGSAVTQVGPNGELVCTATLCLPFRTNGQ